MPNGVGSAGTGSRASTGSRHSRASIPPRSPSASWPRRATSAGRAGAASEDELVPFGGEHAHKAFALAVGLQLLVDSLAGAGFGAAMLVAQPAADPVPALRARAAGVRLPGDG